ncbi:MAG: hypothetical protein M0Q99_11440 [Candidatus Cloacimonetes bacterium]|nr:hypothetical protein [Candidatus Cloacimonadota bacterium]MCK9335909.1 hypothetical protein [Candidatus Cloacimonadota bacterium]
MGLTLPDGIEQDDLLLDALEAVMVGDAAFFALGQIDYTSDLLDNSYYLAYYLSADAGLFAALGELAEMPGKVESKVNRLKTRNYLIAGRRNSSIELVLNGLSELQKDYFESALFSGLEITILLCKNELLAQGVNDPDNFKFPSPITVFSGMRWTADWSAEADGLWSVVITSEVTGATKDRIWAQTVPAYDHSDGGTPPWKEVVTND